MNIIFYIIVLLLFYFITNTEHFDPLYETLSFSLKEKDKITLGKKQSFSPNETTHTKYEFLPQNVKHLDETTHTKYEFLPQNVKHLDETLSFSLKEKDNITNCCLVEKKYVSDKNELFGGNFKYIYTKKTNEECNNDLYNLNSNKQLLFDGVNKWSNKYCDNQSDVVLGSCRNINKECVDFVDKPFCDNYRMKWSPKTCHEPLDFVWIDPVKLTLPEYSNGDGTFILFDKQIK